jgi:hypothetical protein
VRRRPEDNGFHRRLAIRADGDQLRALLHRDIGEPFRGVVVDKLGPP